MLCFCFCFSFGFRLFRLDTCVFLVFWIWFLSGDERVLMQSVKSEDSETDFKIGGAETETSLLCSSPSGTLDPTFPIMQIVFSLDFKHPQLWTPLHSGCVPVQGCILPRPHFKADYITARQWRPFSSEVPSDVASFPHIWSAGGVHRLSILTMIHCGLMPAVGIWLIEICQNKLLWCFEARM